MLTQINLCLDGHDVPYTQDNQPQRNEIPSQISPGAKTWTKMEIPLTKKFGAEPQAHFPTAQIYSSPYWPILIL
jgi:hypothetical protein